MTYRAPLADIAFTLKHVAGLKRAIDQGLTGDLSDDLVDAILDEAGRFTEAELVPLARVGDTMGAALDNGVVTMPPGFRGAYRAWCEGGWNALGGPTEFGGQHLPQTLQTAALELWNSATMAFGLAPTLTFGAIDALHKHGSAELQRTYLAKLVSGEWTATMNLTEPQAGSDLALLKSRAEPAGDGTYRIFGTKIFITYGEHDLTDNIVHMVLARLPDAPAGTRGISLFLVPKFLVTADGSLGARNDVVCTGLEHKLGIHASPTCVMTYGDAGGAIGWLVGEEHRGLACMFTMMNSARLSTGIQGVAVAEAAHQKALAYARDRRQGNAAGAKSGGPQPIAEHPDVRRMLLTQKALTAAARAIAYSCAEAIDMNRWTSGDEARRWHERTGILTPIAKAFSSDIGVEVASLGIQIHGGMGYIEETGAAVFWRDSRIVPIYEGTNGIQAIDLVTRKLPLSNGGAMAALIADLREDAATAQTSGAPLLAATGAKIAAALDATEAATEAITAPGRPPAESLAVATPYLRLIALAIGGALLARAASASLAIGDAGTPGRIALARYFADHLLPEVEALRTVVATGAASVDDGAIALA